MRYQYANQIIASTVLLPELPAAPDSAEPTLHIELHESTVFPELDHDCWQHDWLDGEDSIAISAVRMGKHYGLRFPGVAEAWIEPTGLVALWRDPQASIESLRHVLLDQILPRVLAQRGNLVLHGSMARMADGRAVVILGESGRGKSTLASAFALAGGLVLTDDCVVVSFDGELPCAVPSYGGLRLWGDSLTAMYPLREAEATPVAHYSSKRRLAASDVAGAAIPVPQQLQAVLVLQEPGGGDQIKLKVQPPHQACMSIISNAFQFDLGDLRHTHQLLGLAAILSGHVPILSLQYPRDYALLPSVVARVSEIGINPAHGQA